jgi:hypothetical protein
MPSPFGSGVQLVAEGAGVLLVVVLDEAHVAACFEHAPLDLFE